MPLSRGAVVAVPFPFTDFSGTKTRPAVIVSSDAYNQSRADVLVAAISTQVGRASPFDHVLANWRGAGLRYPSMVKGRIVTLAQTLVIRVVGKLAAADLQSYEGRLLSFLCSDAAIGEAFLTRQLWVGLPADRLQVATEKLVETLVQRAAQDPRCDVQRLRQLLPTSP